ncbi:WcbI family polysaccharide biosynthesis putative acetyltransferase [Nocardioides sp. C4-1]|uniref:WcbI family polysaccharide biosynthesis putative acetyltransferase n=1 Tax=Nocardioides sp. C4-1 TaxID=3151851 RepID=UPI003266FCB3
MSVPPVPPDDGRPLLTVVGNCQAESLRLLIDAGDVRSVRLPAVHELVADDVAGLQALVAATDIFVGQPVGNDYHGLPVGTEQLVGHLPPGSRTALVPSVRYAGLHPYHLLVHPPGIRDPDPPLVPYHDVRTVLAAAARPAPPPLTPDAVLAVAAASVAELDRRERVGGLVTVSDLLTRPVADSMRTINHPGNAVLEPLAARVRAAVGLPPAPPGVDRPLLAGTHAPLMAEVVAAHHLDVAPTTRWQVAGRPLEVAAVTTLHVDWLRRRPEVLAVALERVEPLLELLGA